MRKAPMIGSYEFIAWQMSPARSNFRTKTNGTFLSRALVSHKLLKRDMVLVHQCTYSSKCAKVKIFIQNMGFMFAYVRPSQLCLD